MLRNVLALSCLAIIVLTGKIQKGRSEELTTGSSVVVMIENMKFSPSELTISQGETIRWINNDIVPHTVTALDGTFNSETIAPGKQWEFSFKTQAIHRYWCLVHPMMTGTITVK